MIVNADARHLPIADSTVQCVVTSPPYYGLRDYGVSGQIGLEQTPDEYVAVLVAVFREVWRVLRDDGTVFLNLGDSYFGSNQTGGTNSKEGSAKRAGRMFSKPANAQRATACGTSGKEPASYPDRDCLCGNLCDACRRAYLIGKSHSDTPHVPMPTVLPSESIPAHKEEQIDHLPTSDSVNQEAHNDPAIPGVENFPNREGELLPASPVSKSDEFSPQSQDKSSGASNQGGVCRLCGRSFSRLVPASVDKSTSPCGNCSTFLSSQHLDSHRHDKVSTADASADHIEGKAYDYSYQYYTTTSHLKPKDLIGIPWMVAFALRADGWYLRSDIIWNKPNPMPESVTDRPTKAHEYLFLLTKSARYYYDAEAIFEPASYDGRKDTQFKGATKSYDGVMPNGKPQSFAQDGHERWPNKIQTKYAEDDSTDMGGAGTNWVGHSAYHGADGRELFQRDTDGIPARNKRTVWTINTQPCKEAHYAVMPEKLVEPCILAGSRAGDIILDPFIGSGTVERVAIKHGRKAIGTELKYQYIADIASKRISNIEVMLPLESTYDPNHRPHRHLHPGRWTGWTREA